MPLTSPPDVRIGTDPTWRPTEWDDSPPPNMAEGFSLSPESVKYAHWTVAVDDEAPRGFRLLLAHPGTTRDGAVTVPAGGGAVTYRVILAQGDDDTASETITGPAGRVSIVRSQP